MNKPNHNYDFYADWQPISDGILPNEDDLYLITWEGTRNDRRERWIETAEYCMFYGDEYNCYWDVKHIEKRGFKDVKVIAWMDLPNKWEGE